MHYNIFYTVTFLIYFFQMLVLTTHYIDIVTY